MLFPYKTCCGHEAGDFSERRVRVTGAGVCGGLNLTEWDGESATTE